MVATAGLACVVAAAAFVIVPRKAAVPADTARVSTSAPAPTLSVGTVFRDCPTCPLMIVLPPGQFVQGSGTDASETEPFETPQHSVTIAHAFAASQHEVTVGEFAEFVKAAPRELSGCSAYDGAWTLNAQVSWKNAVEGQTALHPVSCVSWEDARAYADWLSQRTHQKYRLPSASEWEYAARAGVPAARPWADAATACAEANVADQTALQRYPGWSAYPCMDTYVQTAPVGSFAANAFGLHDMLGNVFEWVEDCWYDDYRGAPVDGSARSGGECTQRETRGGSWFTTPAYVRVSYRNRFEPNYRATSVGFRVVRETDT
jgi:formylglycine-generating enzyme required for sulfatase activity